MKKAADFPYYVSKFLARFLPGEANNATAARERNRGDKK
jgi:hypothetical protein